MSSRICVVAVVALTLALTSASAFASGKSETGAQATPTDDGATVGVRQLGQPGVPTTSSGGTVSCSYIEVGEALDPAGYGGYENLLAGFSVTSRLVEDYWYFSACSVNGIPLDPQLFQYTPGDTPISAQFLAREARDTLVLAYPEPHLNPPAEFDQLVGLPTWLWLDPADIEPVTANATIPGLSVTATATPTKVVWDMGDDSEPVICAGPGVAYDPARSDDEQTTDCAHLYQDAGDYTASVTVTWAIEWSASNGEGGTFPSVDRTTTVDVDVIERQAVIIEGP